MILQVYIHTYTTNTALMASVAQSRSLSRARHHTVYTYNIPPSADGRAAEEHEEHEESIYIYSRYMIVRPARDAQIPAHA